MVSLSISKVPQLRKFGLIFHLSQGTMRREFLFYNFFDHVEKIKIPQTLSHK